MFAFHSAAVCGWPGGSSKRTSCTPTTSPIQTDAASSNREVLRPCRRSGCGGSCRGMRHRPASIPQSSAKTSTGATVTLSATPYRCRYGATNGATVGCSNSSTSALGLSRANGIANLPLPPPTSMMRVTPSKTPVLAAATQGAKFRLPTAYGVRQLLIPKKGRQHRCWAALADSVRVPRRGSATPRRAQSYSRTSSSGARRSRSCVNRTAASGNNGPVRPSRTICRESSRTP